jgi:hypothetical protein
VLWWTHRLLLRKTHPWSHRDGVGPRIIDGGPRRGAPTVVVAVAKATGAIVLAFPFFLALSLAFAVVVGVGDRRGRGRLKR